MEEDSIQISTIDADTTFAFQMQLNKWYLFSVQTDSMGWYKNYYINNVFILTHKSSQLLPVETVILGDLSDNGQFGAIHYDDVLLVSKADSNVTHIDNDAGTLNQYSLSQNYPNPFNPNTKIEFQLDNPGHIRLEIYNNRGQKIRKLMDGFKNIGDYRIVWDGTNDLGQKVSSGVYYYTIKIGKGSTTRKMLLLK